MNSTTISISINASWLEGEALRRWASILKRAIRRLHTEGPSTGAVLWSEDPHTI